MRIRKFSTGATRDTNEGKLDYARALCPLVLQYYVDYLGRHRTMPDGSKRDWDNWKKGLDNKESFSSLMRHTHAVHLIMDGFNAYDNHGKVNIKDALCGVIFNATTMLREILKGNK